MGAADSRTDRPRPSGPHICVIPGNRSFGWARAKIEMPTGGGNSKLAGENDLTSAYILVTFRNISVVKLKWQMTVTSCHRTKI